MSQQDFVGREQQLEAVRTPIERTGHRYLVSIHGRGGIGKTYLLRKIHSVYAGQDPYFCFPLVDFSQSKTRTLRWLMDFIAGQAPIGFEQYYRIAQDLSAQARSATAEVLSQEDLEKAFLDDFLELEQQTRCIFLFDTLELIQDTLLLDFLLDMAKIAQNSTFVLAGRRNAELESRFQDALGPGSVVPVTLAGFGEKAAMLYVSQHPAGRDLSEDEQRALHLLTEGVPIKLALALDWLSRGLMMNALAEYSLADLTRLSDEEPKAFQRKIVEFERELVTQIGELGTHVDLAIHMMAHVHKRFNYKLLRLLIPEADTEELAEQIRALPFVKCIEEDYFVLHDEIQRMIVRHIWDWSDPDRKARQEISQKVIAYYDDELTALREQFTTDSEMTLTAKWECRIYEIERLHYQLDINLEKGYSQFRSIFEELEDRRSIELAALTLDILVKDRPLAARLSDFVDTYYRGWVLVRRQRLQPAREHLERGLKRLEATHLADDPVVRRRAFIEREVDQRLGEVYTLLGYCHRLLGNWSMAIDYYEQARKSNKALIDELQQAKEPAEELLKRSVSRLAETLNDIANLQRMQGNLDMARRYCKTSLLIREGLGEQRLVGHCSYVMGMIMWESGNTSEAMHYLEKARGHYRETGEELLEAAWIDHYAGYVMFRTGNTQEALRLLKRALDVTSGHPGLQDEHAEILLFLSRINRQQGTLQSREQALKEANSALSIARKVGNNYRLAECYLTLCLTLLDVLGKDQTSSELRAEFDEYFEAGLRIAQNREYRRLEVVFAEMEADQAYARKDYLSAFEKYVLACLRATEFKPAVFARTLSKLSQRLHDLVDEDAERVIGLCDLILHHWGSEANLDKSYPELRSEVTYIRQMAQDVSRRQVLERIFESEFRHGSWQRALLACDDADEIPIYNHPARADAHQHRAEIYHSENNFSLARLYCERAVRIRSMYDTDPKALGDSYLLLSRIYWKLGNTAESADFLGLAEEQYRRAKSKLGLGAVELERAYIFFRTHQFSRAGESLVEAHKIFREFNDPVLLASTLNVMSRLARIDPRQAQYPEIGYAEADRRGQEALQVLGDGDWFVAAEINLTLCILHYLWGSKLLDVDKTEEAEKHFSLSKEYNHQGWDKIELINSPMLYSVYRGMQGNLFLQTGEKERARLHFLDELVYATRTKHVRLLRALDLLENWLVSEAPQDTKDHAKWFIKAWQKKGLSEKYPEVEEALEGLMEHRRYIPQNV